VEFYTDTSADEIRLLFTAAAECDATDVLKLTTRSGRLLKLSAALPANKPSNRYRLHITAAPVTGFTITSALGEEPTSVINFYARKQLCFQRVLAIAILSVRLSVCLSHGWIRQKRSKLGSPNFHHRPPGRL